MEETTTAGQENSASGPESSIDYMPSIKCRLDCPEIPTLVNLYKPLIVRALKVNDFVHYLHGVIKTRQKERIIQQGENVGSTTAMGDLLCAIHASDNINKWTIFVNIVEKMGYEYVAKALRGEEVKRDAYEKFRKILQPYTMKLVENLDPSDLLPDLVSQGIITFSDREHINTESNRNGNMAAIIVLLDRIWRKKENWYHSFLGVLCKQNYKNIAEEIDEEFVKEWEKTKGIRESTETSQHCPFGIPAQREKYTKPVQCVSDNEEYKLPPSLGLSSLLYARDSKSIEEITSTDKIQEKNDTEETKEKYIEIHNITNISSENETDLKTVCSSKSEAESTLESASLEDKVTLESYEDRKYQNELAEPAQKGKNCIIIAPTGSGKTIVAVKIIQHHLQATLKHKVKKIAFVVDKNNLAKQQSDAIKRYVACRLKVISGDTMRDEEFTKLSALLPQYDIFVVTAQMLVNAMDKEDLSIESFTLIIFDECHHCYGGHAFYKTMVPYFDKMLGGLDNSNEQKILPQIVGLTASIGVGNAKTTEQTVNHVKSMMANLDADVLVSVQIFKDELAAKINSPDQSIVRVPTRKKDDFGVRIISLMTNTENYLREVEDIEDRNALDPPRKKGSEQYTQWLQNVLFKAVAQITDTTLSRSLYTARKYLEIYNNGLIMHSYVRASDSLDTITGKIEELPNPSCEIEQHLKELFENEKSDLQVIAKDRRKTEENPLLLTLKDIIIDTYRTEPNMRGIIFVRTRQLSEILVSWMSTDDELKNIKAKTCTGSNAKRSEGGMTKNKQKDTIELFRKGDFKLIVATTIAEEGLDIKECNLVVRYDYAGNPISQIQAKGRGRADNSRFFILASEDKCVAEREWVNSEKGPMMDEAMAIVQKETEANNEGFQRGKRELQRRAKMQREAAASNNDIRETPSGQHALRCMKCKTFLCLSSEMRKLGSHYACINGDFKNRVFCKKNKKVGYKGDDIQMGLGTLECKDCREKLGVIALYNEVYFPILQIKSLKIEDDMKRGDTVKKWKTVEERYFKVPSISSDDLQKISEKGKLLNFE
ncbi:ATP-dependent RNA helicase DHX58-like [Saccostrea cucullata]|uniref:ATP-dependent RNA helicase DHX58-like n=1 Tax=Saccostrea cuccullata TaxID=36930 RepID=UPI002ECFCB99